MENKKTTGKNVTAGQTADRVVLALSTEQATQLNKILIREFEEKGEDSKFAGKISERITRTLAKQKMARNLRAQGVEPTKERMKKAMDAAFGAVVQAAQEVAEEEMERHGESEDGEAEQ